METIDFGLDPTENESPKEVYWSALRCTFMYLSRIWYFRKRRHNLVVFWNHWIFANLALCSIPKFFKTIPFSLVVILFTNFHYDRIQIMELTNYLNIWRTFMYESKVSCFQNHSWNVFFHKRKCRRAENQFSLVGKICQNYSKTCLWQRAFDRSGGNKMFHTVQALYLHAKTNLNKKYFYLWRTSMHVAKEDVRKFRKGRGQFFWHGAWIIRINLYFWLMNSISQKYRLRFLDFSSFRLPTPKKDKKKKRKQEARTTNKYKTFWKRPS